jgi:hypothetical protein
MIDPALEALWKKVLDYWDDDAAHGAFVEHCQVSNQLLEAAVRYRGMAGDHVRGAAAQKRLEGITLLALSRLETERTSERSAYGVATLARIVLILLFLAGSVALYFALGR